MSLPLGVRPYTVYVHPSAIDDSDTGRDWAHPKRTVMGGYDTLVDISGATGGTLYIADNSPIQDDNKFADVVHGGIWLMSPTSNDPSLKKFQNVSVTKGSYTVGGSGFLAPPAVGPEDRLWFEDEMKAGAGSGVHLVQSVTNDNQIVMTTSYGADPPTIPSVPQMVRIPKGWRFQFNVHFCGVGRGNVTSFNLPDQARVVRPSHYNDRWDPSVWIAGGDGLEFSNLHFGDDLVSIRLGMGTDYAFAKVSPDVPTYTLCSASNTHWYNCSNSLHADWPDNGDVDAAHAAGPGVEIGELSFWHYFDSCQFSGNDAVGRHSNRRHAMVWYNGGNLWSVTNCQFIAGGVRFIRKPRPDHPEEKLGIYSGIVSNLTVESDNLNPLAPVFWGSNLDTYGYIYVNTTIGSDSAGDECLPGIAKFTHGSNIVTGVGTLFNSQPQSTDPKLASRKILRPYEEIQLILDKKQCTDKDWATARRSARYVIQSIESDFRLTLTENFREPTTSGVAVSPGLECDVKSDPDGSTDSLVVSNVEGVVGPATIQGIYPSSWQNQPVTPEAQQQVGFWSGWIAGRHDGGRSILAPAAVRFENLAHFSLSEWYQSAGAQAGFDAPDGTQNAIRVSSDCRIFLQSITNKVGDYFIFGAWVRGMNGLSVNSGLRFGVNAAVQFNTAPPTNNYLTAIGPIRGGGEWRFFSGWGRVVQSPSTSADTYLDVTVDQSIGPVDIFAPVLYRIGGRTITDNEAARLATHLVSTSPSFPSGTVALLPSESFGLEGHFYTAGPLPSLTAGPDAGSNPVISISGTDRSGVISITARPYLLGVPYTGILCTLTFANARLHPPKMVTASPANKGTTKLSVYADPADFFSSPTGTGFIIRYDGTLISGSTYKIAYLVEG